ncbi:uncharacterized protein [Eurosta solidaginis]|uniref:uncharacterized protein n=1 Tax=Eurosta solidaginis TaxID=178769 RepID=UPI003531142E
MGNKRNAKQEQIILSFMQAEEDIARGYTKGDRVEIEQKWADLAKSLNAVGPPCKDLAGWKKSWIDWKGGIKKKLSDNRREVNATGGGPYFQQPISPSEEAIVVLCNLFKSVEGTSGVRRFGLSRVKKIVSSEEATNDDVKSITDESCASTAEPAAETELPSTSRQRRRPVDTFEKVCAEQNLLLKRIADAFDKLLLHKKTELELKEAREKEKKRHHERMEEIEQQKLDT